MTLCVSPCNPSTSWEFAIRNQQVLGSIPVGGSVLFNEFQIDRAWRFAEPLHIEPNGSPVLGPPAANGALRPHLPRQPRQHRLEHLACQRQAAFSLLARGRLRRVRVTEQPGKDGLPLARGNWTIEPAGKAPYGRRTDPEWEPHPALRSRSSAWCSSALM